MEQITHKLTGYFQQASDTALHADHANLACVHVLKAMAQDQSSALNLIARSCRLENGELNPGLDRVLANLPKLAESSGEVLPDKELGKVINLAKREMKKLGDTHLSSDTFVHMSVKSDPAIKKVFAEVGISDKDVATAIQQIRAGEQSQHEDEESGSKALEQYTIDFTALAEDGKLDPVIGRDEEIRRAMQILQRRSKNNPVLIGEPGVGKTAIVEGLAQRIVAGDVPIGLANSRVLGLDLASMVAGASMRGDFEKRLKAVIKEVVKERERYVLFIDELHTLVGAGNVTGGFDAANMLKPSLARGEIRCIGATTLNEYRKYIEADAALERRFQRLLVTEPDQATAVAILRGLADRFIMHHGVQITDDAIVAAVELSSRYMTDRFLPDKAIDLIDEASAKLRIENDFKPEELDQLEREYAQDLLYRHSVEKNWTDPAEKATHLRDVDHNLEVKRQQIEKLTEVWRGEKARNVEIKKRQLAIEEAKKKYDRNLKKQNYEEASRLEYDEIPKLKRELAKLEQEQQEHAEKPEQLLSYKVDTREIAEIVSRTVRVPVARLLASERDALLDAEEFLQARVVNQDAAISVVAAAIQRSRTGLADPKRPNGTFMFLGATGVGKTELAKAVALLLFNNENDLVRIDMSEYMERHAVARLIGAPPGYIGHDDGGQLTEAVRRKPYSVILFDEVEKAHSEVLNLLLQVLDDGRLTDSQGRTVDFRNCVIIMTSNVGAIHLTKGERKGQERALGEVHDYFSPEFLNRLDEIVVFNPLDRNAIKNIAQLQLTQFAERLAEQQLQLEWDDKVLSLLGSAGFDPLFGARPLNREIQRLVETPLAKDILANKCQPQMIVKLTAKNDRLNFAYRKSG